MGVIYTSSSTVIVTNTTVETSILPTPLVIPANGLGTGTTLRFAIVGNHVNNIAAPGTLRVKLKATNATDGTVVVNDTLAQNLTPFAGGEWQFESLYQQRAVGAGTSVVQSGGSLRIWTTLILAAHWATSIGGGGITDSTVATTFDVTVQFSVADAATFIRNFITTIELLQGTN